MSEAILRPGVRRWYNSYKSALRACGDKVHQERKADLALRVCRQRLLEMSRDEAAEREGIRAAISDLWVLKELYRKYG